MLFKPRAVARKRSHQSNSSVNVNELAVAVLSPATEGEAGNQSDQTKPQRNESEIHLKDESITADNNGFLNKNEAHIRHMIGDWKSSTLLIPSTVSNSTSVSKIHSCINLDANESVAVANLTQNNDKGLLSISADEIKHELQYSEIYKNRNSNEKESQLREILLRKKLSRKHKMNSNSTIDSQMTVSDHKMKTDQNKHPKESKQITPQIRCNTTTTTTDADTNTTNCTNYEINNTLTSMDGNSNIINNNTSTILYTDNSFLSDVVCSMGNSTSSNNTSTINNVQLEIETSTTTMKQDEPSNSLATFLAPLAENITRRIQSLTSGGGGGNMNHPMDNSRPGGMSVTQQHKDKKNSATPEELKEIENENDVEKEDDIAVVTTSTTTTTTTTTVCDSNCNCIKCYSDDLEGYYRVRPSEIIGERYRIMSLLGKGVFANVLRCMDTQTSELVAIKIMRKSASMTAAGEKELSILQHLQETDPDDKRHIIRLKNERSLYCCGHLCVILENMNTNLRKVMNQYGSGKGLDLSTVRLYGFQLFKALRHIHHYGYIHCDIKPDNIVINDQLTCVKLCDFGSCLTSSEVQSVDDNSYLAARFYRSPEVILCYGTKGFSLDVWALSVTLVELFK
eukprot:gene5195-10388_t